MVDWINIINCHCGGSLLKIKHVISCRSCKIHYKTKSDNDIIDLLPKKIKSLDGDIEDVVSSYYLNQYKKSFLMNNEKKGWGGIKSDNLISSYFLNDLVNNILKQCRNENNLLIDLTGGSGFITFKLAKYFKKIIFCDISIEALNSAYSYSRRNNINNVYFARCDYLHLPFKKNIANVVTIIDSLEYYGHSQDKKTLEGARDIINNKGKLIFDLHLTRWYKKSNPIREYSKNETNILLQVFNTFNIQNIDSCFLPLSFIINKYMWEISQKYLSFLPPSRKLIVITKGIN